MALLWMTRDPPGDWGWSKLLSNGSYATDGTVAMAACLFLLLAPAEPPFEFCCCKDQNHNQQVQNDQYSNLNSDSLTDIEEKSDDVSHKIHGRTTDGYKPILPWTAVQTLNWDIIFLLGGGFALSEGFQVKFPL